MFKSFQTFVILGSNCFDIKYSQQVEFELEFDNFRSLIFYDQIELNYIRSQLIKLNFWIRVMTSSIRKDNRNNYIPLMIRLSPETCNLADNQGFRRRCIVVQS